MGNDNSGALTVRGTLDRAIEVGGYLQPLGLEEDILGCRHDVWFVCVYLSLGCAYMACLFVCLDNTP